MKNLRFIRFTHNLLSNFLTKKHELNIKKEMDDQINQLQYKFVAIPMIFTESERDAVFHMQFVS